MQPGMVLLHSASITNCWNNSRKHECKKLLFKNISFSFSWKLNIYFMFGWQLVGSMFLLCGGHWYLQVSGHLYQSVTNYHGPLPEFDPRDLRGLFRLQNKIPLFCPFLHIDKGRLQTIPKQKVLTDPILIYKLWKGGQ